MFVHCAERLATLFSPSKRLLYPRRWPVRPVNRAGHSNALYVWARPYSQDVRPNAGSNHDFGRFETREDLEFWTAVSLVSISAGLYGIHSIVHGHLFPEPAELQKMRAELQEVKKDSNAASWRMINLLLGEGTGMPRQVQRSWSQRPIEREERSPDPPPSEAQEDKRQKEKRKKKKTKQLSPKKTKTKRSPPKKEASV